MIFIQLPSIEDVTGKNHFNQKCFEVGLISATLLHKGCISLESNTGAGLGCGSSEAGAVLKA